MSRLPPELPGLYDQKRAVAGPFVVACLKKVPLERDEAIPVVLILNNVATGLFIVPLNQVLNFLSDASSLLLKS